MNFFSSKKGHTNVAKLLIDHGADINAKNGGVENTPLHLAAYGGLSITSIFLRVFIDDLK